ncbi:hypothetical protein CDD83_4640 [Cordyceps sp. RAO-2017]|nr:hypothetical protein CDD83_4640 [Cordyceps sp. RAO-2017]
MAPPSPLHRHQSSLESVIDFSTEPPLGLDQRTQARRTFYHIVNHFEARSHSSENRSRQYNRPSLVRLTYEYARSEESQDNFLRAFFRSMALSMDGEEPVNFDQESLAVEFGSALFNFAEYLLDNFFLPLKASAKKTPQPSPACHSAVQRVQGGAPEFAGTPDRVSVLRGACLVRDRHRCVVSRRFDQAQALRRFESDGDNAQDDDGNLLKEETRPFDALEVAHILPHSLTKTNSSSQLDPSKQAALAILNMFDNGVAHLIEGIDIDRPRNAITLTHGLHNFFGDFRIFLEPTLDPQPHTYRINSFLPAFLVRDPTLPITRTLYLTETCIVDPPSPRLLAIHCAIAHILHLSAAGAYIDKILCDMEEKGVRADGSTEMGRFVKLGLGGWLDDRVHT